MGFELMAKGRWTKRYERLRSFDENVAKPRRCWLKKVNGRFKGLRLSRSRKLNWKPFSLIVVPRKIATMYAETVRRLKMDDICPAIVFSCQWGLPVLSHSTVHCRKSAISFDRLKNWKEKVPYGIWPNCKLGFWCPSPSLKNVCYTDEKL